MKKFMIPGAAAVATAALSLLLGGGVANAQEAAQAPAPVQVPAIHVVDALDSAIKDAPQAPAVPASDVLTFLSDSINLLGRDILSTKDFSAKSLSTLVKAENTPADPQDPNAQSEGEGVMGVIGQVAPYALALLGIPALAIPGGVVGAVAGAVVGAGVAIFAGLAAAVIVASPALIAGLGIALAPSLAIAAVGVLIGLLPALAFLIAGVVAVVSAIVVGLLVITWPLWVPVGLGLFLAGTLSTGTGGAITFAFPPAATEGFPLAVAGIVLMALGLLPGIALVVAGLLFGVAAVVALLTFPLVGISVLVLSVAAFLFFGVMALVGSLGLLPAIVAFVVFGVLTGVVSIPVGALIGLAVGGVVGGVAGAVVGIVAALIYAFVIAPRKKKDEEAPADAPKENKMAVQADYALAA